MALFKESADIQTPDMLNLPVPEAEYESVVLQPSEYQQDMVSSLADRAEDVRDRLVKPNEDNMLKITNDGRKLALDQRLINNMLPDDENSKASVCADKAFEIWERTKEQKSTQLIFCDLSTPKGDGTFNVYEDIKNKLLKKGVPENEIAFIHQANTETRKAELFGKVRSGQVRFLFGSTQKMGAGTNVQDKLIALHHLDVPWRPAEEGRVGRYINKSSKIKAFRDSVKAEIAPILNKKQVLKHIQALPEKERYAILYSWENHRAKAALPLLYAAEGLSNPLDERKEGDAMITYSELIQTGIFIVALISLCYAIFKGKK